MGSKKLIDKYIQDGHAKKIADYKNWQGNAQKLKKAAEKLYDDDEFFLIARMLAGLALENLIKAHLVKNNQTLLDSFNHNLYLLYEKALGRPDEDTKCLLESFAQAIQHEGRYPVAKDSGQEIHAFNVQKRTMIREERVDGSGRFALHLKPHPKRWANLDNFKDLYNKLEASL